MFINPSNDSPNYLDLITLEIQNTEIGIRSFQKFKVQKLSTTNLGNQGTGIKFCDYENKGTTCKDLWKQ